MGKSQSTAFGIKFHAVLFKMTTTMMMMMMLWICPVEPFLSHCLIRNSALSFAPSPRPSPSQPPRTILDDKTYGRADLT